MDPADPTEQNFPPLTSLTKPQRRVLGTLIEKGLTTPDAYPLTLKALTTGCNQKNNRDPLSSYSEDDVQDVMDKLRPLGLAAVVLTETGRTERFRHYLRRRWTISEPQLAILGELLLRGRQSLGDLRGRASRMVAIESLEQLRTELEGLRAMNLIQSDAPLERRGAEVDHTLYEDREDKKMTLRTDSEDDEPTVRSPKDDRVPEPPVPPVLRAHTHDSVDSSKLDSLAATCDELRAQNRELQSEIDEVKAELSRLQTAFQDLKSALGG